MAQAIHCDGEGHLDTLADVLVTNLANGDTSAWCFPHYVDVCRAVAETFDAEVAAATDAEAAARLAGVEAPAGSDQEPGAGGGVPSQPPPADGSEDAATAVSPDDPEASVPAPAAPDLGVSTFREEGHQPVQEDVGSPEAGDSSPDGQTPVTDLNGPPGPPDAAVEDPGEGEPEPTEADARA